MQSSKDLFEQKQLEKNKELDRQYQKFDRAFPPQEKREEVFKSLRSVNPTTISKGFAHVWDRWSDEPKHTYGL